MLGYRLFNTTLQGPGQIWISSMPMEKLRKLFPQQQKKQKKGAAGVAGALIANA
jgi:uncharacterized protein (AIM24 family)